MRRCILTAKQSMGFSALLLAATLAAFSFAQTKPDPKAAATQTPRQYQVTIMRVQPGMAREWAAFMKSDVIPALQKAGVNQYYVWRTATFGEPGEVILARPIESLAEFDAPSLIVKALGQEGAAALQAKGQRVSTISRSFILTGRSDLGIAPISGYEIKLAVLVTTSVAPGRTADYEKNTKEMLAILGKTNVKGVLTGKVGLGGNPNEYLMFALFDSFDDLGKFGPAAAKAFAEAKPAPQEAGIVTHSEYSTVRFVPELSTQPPAQKTAK